jgi:hypothetical protein
MNVNESGLWVTISNNEEGEIMQQWLDDTDCPFYAEYEEGCGAWLFEEDETCYDELEKSLAKEFFLLNVTAEFEGIF